MTMVVYIQIDSHNPNVNLGAITVIVKIGSLKLPYYEDCPRMPMCRLWYLSPELHLSMPMTSTIVVTRLIP
jgi:hypothetical protein